MNQEMVKVTIDGKEHEYAIGTTYREIVDEMCIRDRSYCFMNLDIFYLPN